MTNLTGFGGSRGKFTNLVEPKESDFPDNSNNSLGNGNGRRILKGLFGIPKQSPG